MKKLILSFALMLFAFVGFAQDVTHTVVLDISSVMELEADTTTGATLTDTLNFTTIQHLTDGVESGTKKMFVRSNKNWKVQVKAAAANFTFTPATSGDTYNLAAGALSVKEGSSAYQALTTTYANIKTGSAGGYGVAGNALNVKYKANPGFSAKPGIYAMDVHYTVSAQ